MISSIDSRFAYLHVVGGFLGNSAKPTDSGFKSLIIQRLIATHDAELLRVENDSRITDPILTGNYMSSKSSWLIVVDYTKLSPSVRKKAVRLAQATGNEHKIWLFLIPYSNTRDGFPAYQQLTRMGFSGYWGTYLSKDDIKYLLRDPKQRADVTYTVAWVARVYNRDPKVICDIYANFDAFAAKIDELPDTKNRRRYVTETYGVSTSSPLDYVRAIFKGKASFEQGYRLYMDNPAKFKPTLIWVLDKMALEKSHMLLGIKYDKKYARYVEDLQLPEILEAQSKIQDLNLSSPSNIMFLTGRGEHALLQL